MWDFEALGNCLKLCAGCTSAKLFPEGDYVSVPFAQGFLNEAN